MTAKLILMRHGQSVWNKKNLFTGWVDIPLSEEGMKESMEGGKKIRSIPIDCIYTSRLIRAQMTVVLALLHHESHKTPLFLHTDKEQSWGQIYSEEAKRGTIPVVSAWELNERMYGHLQGLNKAETAAKYGTEQVHLWRRSFSTPPPEGESLEMTAKRTLPYFHKQIVPHLEKGETVFIAAHGNSLRSIIMDIEQLSHEQILAYELATGDPLIYIYQKGQWKKA